MSEPIRIAHVIGKLSAAGVESVINSYYKNIDHTKYQFDFFIDSDSMFTPPKENLDSGAKYYLVPPYKKLNKYVFSLIEIFKRNNYLIVHSNMNTLSVFSMFAAWKAGVPIRINHNHSTAGKGETKKNVLKYILRPFSRFFATDFCACSRYAGIWLFGKENVDLGKVTIFNNAIDLHKFQYNENIRNEYRKNFGIDNKFVIGHVGRFCYQKNHSFLIDTFKKINEKNKNTVLILIGVGELENEIKEKVIREKLENSVIFLGARKDVNNLYQAMDVFLLPSRYEGLPVVGIEAQAAGLPCVFSSSMTNEILITDNTIMIDLEKGANYWSDVALSFLDFKRCDNSKIMEQAGYSIKKEAKKLETYYDRKLKELER